MRSALSLLACLALFAGCTTLRSTMLHRVDDDSLVRDRHHTLPGVPITLQVPAHLDVTLVEEYLLARTPQGLQELSLPETRSYSLKTEIIKTKKIFLVDFKRPGSGTLKYELDFNSEQYLTGIANQIEDNTIKDITAAVQSLSPLLQPSAAKTSAAIPDAIKDKVSVQSRHIAFRRFDLDAPDFEEQFNAWVGSYVTQCNACGKWVEPVVAADPSGR